jgi:hypothetical protein
MSCSRLPSIVISITFRKEPRHYILPSTGTLVDLSEAISSQLSVPPSLQKFAISQTGTFKPPFQNGQLPLHSICNKIITLIASTPDEVNQISNAISQTASSREVLAEKDRHIALTEAARKQVAEYARWMFNSVRPLQGPAVPH